MLLACKIIAIPKPKTSLPQDILNDLYQTFGTAGNVELSEVQISPTDTLNLIETILRGHPVFNITSTSDAYTPKTIIISSWKSVVSDEWRQKLLFFIQGCLDHQPPFPMYMSVFFENQHQLVRIQSAHDFYNNLHNLHGFNQKKDSAPLAAHALSQDNILALDQQALERFYSARDLGTANLLHVDHISNNQYFELIKKFPEINGIEINEIFGDQLSAILHSEDGKSSLLAEALGPIIRSNPRSVSLLIDVVLLTSNRLNHFKNILIQNFILYQPSYDRLNNFLGLNFEHLEELTLVDPILLNNFPANVSPLHVKNLTFVVSPDNGVKRNLLTILIPEETLKIYGSFEHEKIENEIPGLAIIQALVLHLDPPEEDKSLPSQDRFEADYESLISQTKNLKSLEIKNISNSFDHTKMSFEKLEKVTLIDCGEPLIRFFEQYPGISLTILTTPEKLTFKPTTLPTKSSLKIKPLSKQPIIKSVVTDTRTDFASSSANQTIYYEGSPAFPDCMIRESFETFDFKKRELVRIIPTFPSQIDIPKHAGPFSSQELITNQYLGTFEIKPGKMYILPTPSANTTALAWWCDEEAIVPTFFKNTFPDTYGVLIPSSQTHAEQIVLHVKVKAQLIFDWKCPIDPLPEHTDSPLLEALSRLKFKQILKTLDADLSKALYQFFEVFDTKKPKDWADILKENDCLNGLEFSEGEKNILTILLSQKGCCRHIAWGMQALLRYLGFEQSILIGNTTHLQVEFFKDNQWISPYQPYIVPNNYSGENNGRNLFKRYEEKQNLQPIIQKFNHFLDPTPAPLHEDATIRQILKHQKSLLMLSDHALKSIQQALLHSIARLHPELQVMYCENEKMLQELARFALNNVCIIVNWSSFSKSHRVSNQSILDPISTLKGRPFSYFKVIGLYEAKRIEDIPEDLRSRHDTVFNADLTEYTALPSPSVTDLPTCFPLNLRQGFSDWRALFVGRPVLQKGVLEFEIEEGVLHRIQKSSEPAVLRLINPPRSREFKLFLDNMMANKRFIGPYLTKPDEKIAYRLFDLPQNFSYIIENEPVTQATLPTITEAKLNAFRKDKKTIWVITNKNHTLFLPHSAVKPGSATLFKANFSNKIREEDIVCFSYNLHPEIHNLILENCISFQNIHHIYQLPDTFFDISFTPLQINASSAINTFFLSKNTQTADLFYTYTQEADGHLSSTSLPFWGRLRNAPPIKLVGITEKHPLFETFVIAQKTGQLLLESSVLFPKAPFEFCQYMEPPSSQTIDLISTVPNCLEVMESCLSQNPILQLVGPADSGKSTLISKLETNGTITPYRGWKNIEAWILSKNQNATLILDNVSSEDYLDHLLGIRHGYLFFKGENKIISADKRIIIIQSQEQHSIEQKRQLAQYCSTIRLQEVPAEALIQATLDKLPEVSDVYKQTFQNILTSFIQLVRDNIPHSFSFSSVAMIAKDSYTKQKDSTFWIANACVKNMDYFFKKYNKKDLLLNWYSNQGCKILTRTPFIQHIIENAIKPRLLDRENQTLPFPFGKYMVLFEGESGIGKSWSIRNFLEKNGFSTQTLNDEKKYIDISFDAGPEQLIEAATKGWVAVFDEMNAGPEILLNAWKILSECNIHPNFRLFASQNSASDMEGRQILPEQILAQTQCILLPPASDEDILNILNSKFGENNDSFPTLVRTYKLVKETRPITPRDLLRFIEFQ